MGVHQLVKVVQPPQRSQGLARGTERVGRGMLSRPDKPHTNVKPIKPLEGRSYPLRNVHSLVARVLAFLWTVP